LAVLPQEVAERFIAFPFAVDKVQKKLSVAMADPLNLTAIEFIEQKTGYRVIPLAGAASQVKEFVATKYATSLSQEVTEALEEVGGNKSREL